MPLDLLVPHLMPSRDAPPELRGMRMPVLERWLAGAERARLPAAGAPEWLSNAFGVSGPAAVAPISLAGEGLSAEGTWVRADPVHLRLDRGNATVHAPAGLDIEPEEAQALIAALRAHFEADGFEFLAPSPERWYARVPGEDVPATPPLESVNGRSVRGMLPDSGGAVNWRRMLTEAQMLMGTHEVNAFRESRRRPAINSLWVWGGGALPASVRSPYDAVHVDDVFARGLAALAGTPVSDSVATLAALAPQAARVLAMVDGLSRALERGDLAMWREVAAQLDAHWFEPLGAALPRWGEVRVILPSESGTLVATLRKPSLWSRFSTPRPLASYG